MQSHLSFLVDGERLRRSGWAPTERLDETIGSELARFTNLAPSRGVSERDLGQAD